MFSTIVLIGFIDSDTIELRLELGHLIDAAVQSRVPAGLLPPDESGWIRDGEGKLIGRVQLDGTRFMPVDTFRPSAIDHLFWPGEDSPRRAPADDPSLWSITVNGVDVDLAGLARKAHLTETALTAQFERFSTVQNVFFDLHTPLAEGDVIRISFDDAAFQALTTTFAPSTTISEAIHVNLTGYDPDDIRKIGFLSSWNGWQLDPGLTEGGRGVPQVWGEPMTFHIVNEATGARDYTGQTVLAAPADAPTDLDTNFAGTDVWQMNFSAFKGSGSFHLVVEDVGRSQSFGIADDHWSDIFETAFSGFYHARSGIALDNRWSDWTRERSLHPDDGIVTVYATDVTLIETGNGYLWDLPFDKFEQVIAGATTEVVEGAWGGWHDAGDWDRRTSHMEPARQLLELMQFARGNWVMRAQGSIPETVNNTPDLIDEAAWGLGIFRRMQTEEGGIRGGVEGDAYRSHGAGSWFEPTQLYAYAPDIWSSWEYAASAARLARLLGPHDPVEAAGWLDSAQRAMAWAEAESTPWVAENGPLHLELNDSRNLAALELYIATGEARWHDLFKETSNHRTDRDLAYYEYQTEAAFHYAMLNIALTDPVIAARARANFLKQVQWYLDNALNSGFGYSFNPYSPNSGTFGAPTPTDAAHFFVRAHILTGEARYLSAVIDEVQYALGANPMNMAFLTGLEDIRGPEEILHADADSLGRDPPPGIVIFGESRYGIEPREWYHDTMEPYVWPLFHQRPGNETYNGYYGFVPSAEFTVMRSISDMAYVTGYLAALEAD